MFRLTTFVCLFVCLLSDSVLSQEEREQEDRPTYNVALTEFQLKSGNDPEVSSQAIIAAFHAREKNDNVKLVETIRLTLQADLECTAQFSKTVQVTKGVINNGRAGVQRVTQAMELGTMAQVRVSPEDDKLVLRLRYSASRFGDEVPADGPPDLLTSSYNATIAIEPGKPALVGGTDSESASYLIVYVH